MNTFTAIDVLNKGGIIEKGKTEYSIYQGVMIASKGNKIIINPQIKTGGFLGAKLKVKTSCGTEIVNPENLPEKKIKLNVGEIYLTENGLKVFVAKIIKQKAFCSIEGNTLTFAYSRNGKASARLLQKRGSGYNLVKKIF